MNQSCFVLSALQLESRRLPKKLDESLLPVGVLEAMSKLHVSDVSGREVCEFVGGLMNQKLPLEKHA